MLIVVIGRSFRKRFKIRSFAFIFFSLSRRCHPRRNDPDTFPLANQMNHKKQSRILTKPNRCIPRFLIAPGINKPYKRVEEYLACSLKRQSMFPEIGLRLLHLPLEKLTKKFVGGVHRISLNVYTLYGRDVNLTKDH